MDRINHNIIAEISKHLELDDKSRLRRCSKLYFRTITIPEPTKNQLDLWNLKKLLKSVQQIPYQKYDMRTILTGMILLGYKSNIITDFDILFSLIKKYDLESAEVYKSIINEIIPYLEEECVEELIALSKYWVEYFDRTYLQYGNCRELVNRLITKAKRQIPESEISKEFLQQIMKCLIEEDYRFMRKIMTNNL